MGATDDATQLREILLAARAGDGESPDVETAMLIVRDFDKPARLAAEVLRLSSSGEGA